MSRSPLLLESAQKWTKLGRILEPRREISWLSTWTGAAFAVRTEDPGRFDLFLTGRDRSNRSRIGRAILQLDPPKVIDIDPDPVLELGEPGMFDENGTSYPCVVPVGSRSYLYYTGWVPTCLTSFQNHLGLAVSRPDGTFRRVSRAPILPRTDDDPLSTGAVNVLRDGDIWRMWYTSFLRWGRSPEEPKHTYVIKYAESRDGIDWQRPNRIAIDLEHTGEHSISRPSVLKRDGQYHMWYCYRGESYRIGYATSTNGIAWRRRDERVGLSPSERGWDSGCLCYPHVVETGASLYMLYCGNDYGRSGLGLARLEHE